MNNKHTLWVEKYRPDALEGYLGNEDFITSLDNWIAKNDFPNLLLYGPPGTGKTTAAKLIVKNIKCDNLYLNCSDENGIETIRDTVKQFASSASFKPLKVVILDEADFLTTNAQAALRNVIEAFSASTRFIFTCNYVERISQPLQSRLALFELKSPDKVSIAKRITSILKTESIEFDPKDVAAIVKKTYPDIRRTLNTLQSSVKNNKIVLNNKLLDSNYTDQILNAKTFNEVRQIIADNGITDFTSLYRSLYDKYNSAEATIIIEEYLYHSTTVPDKEICFMACISKLL